MGDQYNIHLNMEADNQPVEPLKPSKLDIFKSRWKQNWDKKDVLCSQCGTITLPAKGINKQNMRRLFIGKPSMYDWIFFFIIVATLFMAYQYNIETSQCRYALNNLDAICAQSNYMAPANLTINNNLNNWLPLITSNETR